MNLDAPTPQPLPTTDEVLNALRSAAAAELDRKRRLGHDAVFWEDGRVVMRGDDVPTDVDATAIVAAEPAPPWPGPSAA